MIVDVFMLGSAKEATRSALVISWCAIELACGSEPTSVPAPAQPVVAEANPASDVAAPVPEPVSEGAQSTVPALEIVGAPLVGYERIRDNIGRSIWDLESSAGLVFLGYGDGTANTGPTDVIAYDPRAAVFRVESTLEEEAIMSFRVFGDRVLVPGADPVGSPKDGALHVRERGAWRVVAVPDAVHVFDVVETNGRLFVALQAAPNRAAVYESRDDGASWRKHFIRGWRGHMFFTVDDSLYVSAFGGGISQQHGKSFRTVDTDLGRVPPPSEDGNVDPTAEDSFVVKAARCGEATWLIVSAGSLQTGYGTQTLKRVRTKDAGLSSTDVFLDGKPEDLFVWNDRCHVVTNDAGEDATTIRIHVASDDAWEVVAQASAQAIARSALRIDDHYWLGLGCRNDGCGEDAGLLARLPAPHG